MKKVAVITPAYNRLHLLDRLYNSLANQECQDFTWYFIDDGSEEDLGGYIAQKISERERERERAVS
ncbi:MAG: glycosyltransferase, partial [Clostridiales bacterium]|nr:glycosyltransferase [Clostridiales bacterium]